MGFMLTGVAYDAQRQATIQNFNTADGMLVLRLSQQPLKPDFQSIGPAAPHNDSTLNPPTGWRSATDRYTQPGANGVNRADWVGLDYDAGFDQIPKQQRISTGENEAEKPLVV